MGHTGACALATRGCAPPVAGAPESYRCRMYHYRESCAKRAQRC